MIFKDFKITFGGEIICTFSLGGGHKARHRLEVKAELVISQSWLHMISINLILAMILVNLILAMIKVMLDDENQY